MKTIERIVEVIIFVLLLSMAGMVFANVVGRYLLGTSLTWAHELARYQFVWLTFLGAAIGLNHGAHVGMDLLTEHVGPRVRVVLTYVADATIFVFLYVWFRFGFRLIDVNIGYRGPGSGIPMTLVYAVGPVASVLAAVFLTRRVVARITSGSERASTE